MKALYTGSFDPLTNGHMDVIARISHMHDEVIVGVAVNESKKYMFPLELRMQMIRNQVPGNVTVMSIDGLVSIFAMEHGVDVIIRGIRNSDDVESETNMATFNKSMGIETLFLPTNPIYQAISSTSVKFLASTYVDTSDYVSPHVKHNLEYHFGYSLIGVVGNTGSGKSTICKKLIDAFRKINHSVIHIDVDKLAHKLYDPMEPTYDRMSKQLIHMFGGDVINKDGTGSINRKLIAEKIFSDSKIKNKFDSMIKKPLRLLITKEIFNRINLIRQSGSYKFEVIVLIDASSLVENNSLGLVNNNVIHVSVDKSISIERIKNRDSLTDEHANSRYLAQGTPDDRDARIHEAITRDGYGALLKIDGTESDISSFLLDSILKMAHPNND